MTSKLVVNTIEADTGISSVSFASSISMSSTSKFHFGDAGIDIGADTNINRPTAGALGFNINSSEKVRITSAGNVGIGSAIPQAKFVVSNAGANGFEFNPDFNSNNSIIASYNRTGGGSYSQLTLSASQHIFAQGGTEYARFDASGRLGIGTDNPTEDLHITGDTPVIRLEDSDTSRQSQIVCIDGNLRFDADNNNAQADTNISFRTDGTEVLRITSDRKVGINRTSPARHLHAYAAGAGFVAKFEGSYSYSAVEFADTGTTNAPYIGSKSDDFTIATGGNNERLRINSSGFVGINSTTPRTNLQVTKGSSHYNPGNPTAFNSNNVLACFENSDDVEVTLLSPNNKKNIINFGDTDNTANSSIEYDHSINHLLFKVNGGSERFRINNSGAFGLAGTNYGTAGQFLKSNGSNAVPTWGDAGGLTTEIFAYVSFGTTYDTNSGYVVQDVSSLQSGNGITVNNSNERLTPTVAGKYFVMYMCNWLWSFSGGATFYNRITKNGSEQQRSTFSKYDPGSHTNITMCVITMDGSSDYVQFEGYENKSGQAAYMGNLSRAVMFKLRD